MASALRVYRLAASRYDATVLSGEGGLVTAGRWHRAGRRVIYTATSEALAVLELRVHLGPLRPLAPFTLTEIELPDAAVDRIALQALGRGWSGGLGSALTQDVGDAWIAAGLSLALRVPSVHSASDANVLVNPQHADARRLRVIEQRRYVFDPRLF